MNGKLWEKVRSRVPLTLQGGCTLLLALYLLARGLSTRNAYEILIGAFFILALGTLLAIGFAALRKGREWGFSWQVPEAVLAQSKATHRVSGFPPPPLFFRYHVEIRGSLRVGNHRAFWYSVDWPAQYPEATGTLPFAVGGEFQGVGHRTLRDTFGFTRYSLPPALRRGFPVLPAPSRKQVTLRLDPTLGIEEKRTLRSSDEERYFMREYAPGDRFRDINWKTSSRLSFLVTRIAPQAQEKTRVLPVAFRSLGPARPDLLALWTLDRAKAWFFQFLWTVRREHPDFILRVYTPGGETELSTDAETEEFCAELSGSSYHPAEEEGKFSALGEIPEEVFVFSSSYDRGLPRFVGNRFDRPTHLYLTVSLPLPLLGRSFGDGGKRSPLYRAHGDRALPSAPVESFRTVGSLLEGSVPSPSLLTPLTVPLQPTVRPLRGTVELQYVEVRP